MKARFENNKLLLEDSPFTLTPNADFWRMFLDDGVYREITVHSYKQTPCSISENDDSLAVSYDRLLAEDGKTYAVNFTVYVEHAEGEIRFSFDVESRCEIRVNEVMCPFVDFSDCGCPHEDEELFYANGLGCRIKNLRTVVGWSHTEYVSADYHGIQRVMPYPSVGMTMPWLAFAAGEYTLYIADHAPEMNMVAFVAGTQARGCTDAELYFAISHYPAATCGEVVHGGHSVLKLFRGDWRLCAEYYRRWSESVWYEAHERPQWIDRMTGWQRVIMKHQYGEIFFRYADLVDVFKNGMKYGINTLLVFGWWKGCFDNHYPEYEIDPELGGEEALKVAIEEIHALGGHVHLYTNGNLIDKATDFYRRHADDCAALDIDGNPYEEHYRFSNEGTLLRAHGYKSFVTACSGTELWREQLLAVGRYKLSLGADSIFYDQFAANFRMCFNSKHLHGKRIDRDAYCKWQNMKAIRAILPEENAFGTECVVDRLTSLVDFTHGCNNGNWYDINAFPDIFRHTFPEAIMSNRFLHDDKPGFKRHLNYAFVYGFLFDVSVNRGRLCDMSGYPAYAAYVREMIDYKEEYRRFFYGGTYSSACELSLPKGVFAANYSAGDERITAVCNNTDSEVTLDIYGKQVILPSDGYTVVERPHEDHVAGSGGTVYRDSRETDPHRPLSVGQCRKTEPFQDTPYAGGWLLLGAAARSDPVHTRSSRSYRSRDINPFSIREEGDHGFRSRLCVGAYPLLGRVPSVCSV